MRTEYKYGLGRDRRELSYYQSPEWCRQISKIEKEPLFGENGPNSKLKEFQVRHVRVYQKMPRWIATILADELDIAVAYVYHLRKRFPNGRYKKWAHLK